MKIKKKYSIFHEYQIVLIYKNIFSWKKVQRQLIKIIITMRQWVHYKMFLEYRTVKCKKYDFCNLLKDFIIINWLLFINYCQTFVPLVYYN